MNIIEIHLILNHIPIIGVAFVSTELLIGLVWKNTFLQKVSLYFLIAFAIISIAVYVSGLGSEDLVKTLPGVSKAYLQLHEKVARISSLTVWFVGGLTILGLACLRGRAELFRYFVRGIFAMSLLCTGLFVLTGYLGGQITHAEIRSALAQGLSTRTLSIGVVVVMAVVLLAMLLPLFLNRDKLFGMVVPPPAGFIWQGRDVPQQAGQLPWGEQDGGLTAAPAWGLPSSLGGGGTQQWPGPRPQALTWGQPATGRMPGQQGFSASPPHSWDVPGVPGDKEHRWWSEERTLSLPSVSIAPKLWTEPGHQPGRPKGRRGQLVALGLLVILIVLAGLGFAVLRLRTPASLPLQVVADIPLSHGPNRFDYQSLDPQTRLLFIAHSGANIVTIFDTVSMKVVADVADITDVHGVVAAPDLGLVYAEATGLNQVEVINEHTRAIVARIPVGDAPDGMAYDPTDHKLFVSDELGQNDAVIDTRTQRRIAEIPIGGNVGATAYDPVSHRIVVEAETLNQLVVLDPVTDQVTGRYDLPGCQDSQSLLIDEQQDLAFVGCETNSVLLMFDLHSMHVLSTQPVGAGPDLMALDSGWHYLYVASESGVVSVFDEQARTLRKLGEGYVAVGAHTIAVDPVTHDLFLPLQNIGGSSILRVALFHP
jgi:DNA-binding beta-propeller fold protein YncE